MRGIDKLPVFPLTAGVGADGCLSIGGCDVQDLATEFGTPLYVFDEETLRDACSALIQAFSTRYPEVQALYACKAFMALGLLRLLEEEGLGLDVVSAGEMAAAAAANFPMERVYFHGNNKAWEELEQAVQLGVGRIVIDNLHELDLLEAVCRGRGQRQPVLLRLSPGVDPHTHRHTTTGILDSKFGLPIVTGQAEEAVARATRSSYLELLGLHFHLGSPIWDVSPYQEAIPLVLDFAVLMAASHGLELREFSPGGGFAVRYLVGEESPNPVSYAEAITTALKEGCTERGLPLPRLIIEPGRAIVGRSGVALYTVGAIKEVPGVRTYVAVDGGMADNIRPALYDARYEAVLATRMHEEAVGPVTIAGRYCESGDILVWDVLLPPVLAGDLVAVPVSGAYCLAMSSNYNLAQRPAVVLVRDGEGHLWRRRETLEDLLRYDQV